MENQHLHNQDEIDKLRSQNEELKKNLEREQVLHGLLYKEWKDLDEQRAAKEFELQHPKPKNLFYKYAFYVILILLFPAIIFLTSQKNRKSAPQLQLTKAPLTTDSAKIKDSVKMYNSALATPDSIKNPDKNLAANNAETQSRLVPEQPVQAQERNSIQQDTSLLKPKVAIKYEPDLPLTDSAKDSIYWIGWNAYYKKVGSHFRKSSQKYKAWLEGYNDGRNDAKKLLAKDSINRR